MNLVKTSLVLAMLKTEAVPQLEDNPGITKNMKLSVLHVLFFPGLVSCGR